MDEQTQQFGSFGNVSPEGMSAIRAAISRRQGGTPTAALNQQSGVSPTASPLPAQPSGSMPTAGGNMIEGMTGGVGIPTAPTAQQGNPEAKIILGAMRERLKAISQVELGGMA